MIYRNNKFERKGVNDRRDEMNKKFNINRDDGNVLIMSVVIVALLLATGLGYMKWAVDERWDSAYEEATVQAYFLAQAGVVDRGMEFLRTREPSNLPQGTIFLPPKDIPGVGSYKDNKVMRVTSLGSGSVFERSDTYDLFSTGKVGFYNHQNGSTRGNDHIKYVERTATLRARLRSFANYMYLSNIETTRFNEVIWFWSPDTLWGRVHSNDQIGIKISPHFYGPISSCADDFVYMNVGAPHFEYDPLFNVAPVFFPTTANSIRNNARPFVSDMEGRLMTRVKFDVGTVEFWQRPLGGVGEGDEELVLSIASPAWGAMFVDGQCEVDGVVTGKMTLGSSGDMWLIDDIRYQGAGADNGRFSDMPTPENVDNVRAQMKNFPHQLGLVSESNIIIRDNNANGKENGFANGGNQGVGRHSIIIDAAMVALGESFTFQHQNDDFEAYQGPEPDERGIIHLTGAVTQWRRGYVHRSNHGGTGYGKDYLYDFRLDERPPPFYLEAVDENGSGLFDIVSWGEVKPTR